LNHGWCCCGNDGSVLWYLAKWRKTCFGGFWSIENRHLPLWTWSSLGDTDLSFSTTDMPKALSCTGLTAAVSAWLAPSAAAGRLCQGVAAVYVRLYVFQTSFFLVNVV
jgi:hypothetical protein